MSLPTPDEILTHALADIDRAYAALGDAGDWSRSDWYPVGSALTDEQVRRKAAMWRAIRDAKGAINEAKGEMYP